MSEKKEFKPLDVGASERVPWKIAKGLAKNIGFKEDGSIEVGKNLEVDGVASFLGKEVKILNYYKREGSNEVFAGYFIGYCEKDVSTPGENYFYINGIFADSENDGMYAVFNSFTIDNAVYDITDDKIILTEDGVGELHNYAIPSGPFKTLFGNQSIVGDGNIDLYRHKLTLNGSTATLKFTFEFISSKNLVCDSVADLRTLIGGTGDTFNGFYIADSSVTNAPSGVAYLTVNPSVCQFYYIAKDSTTPVAPINITTVADKVTTI